MGDLLSFNFLMTDQRCPDTQIAKQAHEAKVILSDLKIDILGPDFGSFHMLTCIIDSSLQYLLALLFILSIQIVMLNCEVNKALP